MELPEVTTHAILLDETRKQILLIKWRNPLGEIMWGFPGGHIELGERVEEAAMREVKEETGYDVRVERLLGVYDNIVKDDPSGRIIAHVINIVWMAKIVSGILDFHGDEEAIAAKWVSFSRAKKLGMSASARKILCDTLSVIDCTDYQG